MFLEIIFGLALLSLALFWIPKMGKIIYASTLIGLGGIAASLQAIEVLMSGETLYYSIYGVGAENLVKIDQLSALFILTISIVGISTAIYSVDYLKNYINRKRSHELSVHLVSMVVMFYSMLFVTVVTDMFLFLLFWELMTVASFVIVVFDAENKKVSRSAINYLILMHIGYVFLIAGFTISSGVNWDGIGGSAAGGFAALQDYFATQQNILPVFLLFLIGFGMKAGMFPMHVWIPEIYPIAPSHVSSIMSGAVTKMGVYGVMRVLWCLDSELMVVGYIILGLGILTALWGVIMCAVQNNIKKLLAYSSVENIGIMFMALGVGVLGKASGNQILAMCGFGGALLHMFNHSCFKSMLFMSAGNVEVAAKTVNMDHLGGLAHKMPVTMMLFLIGSIAICALPPLNGFISEYMIYNGLFSTIASGTDLVIVSLVCVVVLSMVGGIALLAFGKGFSVSFLGASRSSAAAHAKEVGYYALSASALPLSAMLIVGFMPYIFSQGILEMAITVFHIPMINRYGMSESFMNNDFMNISILFLTLAATTICIYYLKTKTIRRRKVTESVTWGCGFTAPTAKMQYTGESFAKSFERLSAPMTADRNRNFTLNKLDIFPHEKTFTVKRSDIVGKAVGSRWLKLSKRITARMALFQTGKVNHYVLHALLFIAFILILSIIGII